MVLLRLRIGEEGVRTYGLFDPVGWGPCVLVSRDGFFLTTVSRDVVFDEDASWSWGTAASAPDAGPEPFSVKFMVNAGAPPMASAAHGGHAQHRCQRADSPTLKVDNKSAMYPFNKEPRAP